MSFHFVLIPSDGAAESLVGGETDQYPHPPSKGDTVLFHFESRRLRGEVIEVIHYYYDTKPVFDFDPTQVVVRLSREDYEYAESNLTGTWSSFDYSC